MLKLLNKASVGLTPFKTFIKSKGLLTLSTQLPVNKYGLF